MLDSLFDGSINSLFILGCIGTFILMCAASLCWLYKHSKGAKAAQKLTADDVEGGEKSKMDGEDSKRSSPSPAEGCELNNQVEPTSESEDPLQTVEHERKGSVSTAADSQDAPQVVDQENIAGTAADSQDAPRDVDQEKNIAGSSEHVSQDAEQVESPQTQKDQVDGCNDSGVVYANADTSEGVDGADMQLTESEEVSQKVIEADNTKSVTEPDQAAVAAVAPSNSGFCAKCCMSDSEKMGMNVIPPAEGAVAPLAAITVGKT